jgi:hypothetical protein
MGNKPSKKNNNNNNNCGDSTSILPRAILGSPMQQTKFGASKTIHTKAVSAYFCILSCGWETQLVAPTGSLAGSYWAT